MHNWYQLPIVIGMAVTVVILGMAIIILWKIFTNEIDLTHLIAENGKASLSRFQLLVFTFVIAGIYLLLCIESGTFVDIPESVLGLLGISSASYVLSKGIGAKPAPTASPPDEGAAEPARGATTRGGLGAAGATRVRR